MIARRSRKASTPDSQSRHRGNHLQQPRAGIAKTTDKRSRSADPGGHARASSARRYRLRRRQLAKLPAALGGLADWGGRIVIDANNPIEAPLFKPVDLKGRVSSEVFADLATGARVVKAFNHLRAEVLADDPRRRPARAVLFRQRQRSKSGSGGTHRSDRLLRHRSWIARGRRQARSVSGRTAAEPKSRQGRLNLQIW